MASTIDTGISNSILVPGFYFTISSGTLSAVSSISDVLIIGQAIQGGAISPTPVIAGDINLVAATYGYGSMIEAMYRRYRANDAVTRVWLLPLSDISGAASGSSTVTFGGVASVSGTHYLYTNYNLISVPVQAGDNGSVSAAKYAAAINANILLTVTASANANVVTVTAKNAGLSAGDITIYPNFAGPAAGEVTPFGASIVVASTPGATDPDIALALENLGSQGFDVYVSGYGTVQAANAFNALLSETSGRWSAIEQLFGFAFGALKGPVSAIVSESEELNSKYVSYVHHDSVEPAYLVSATYAGTAAASIADDPALPLQTLVLDCAPSPASSILGFSDRQTLLSEGISTVKQNGAGEVYLERAVTLNKTDSLGLADNSYQDVETMFTLSYVVRYFRAALSTAFARKKLVADGTIIPQGSNFVTSKTVLAAAVAVYKQLADAGMVSDPKTFNANCRSEDAGSGRVNLYCPIVLANQLRIVAVNFSFSKA